MEILKIAYEGAVILCLCLLGLKLIVPTKEGYYLSDGQIIFATIAVIVISITPVLNMVWAKQAFETICKLLRKNYKYSNREEL